MQGPGGIEQRVEPGVLVLDLAVPGEVDVVQPSGILEGGAGGLAADRPEQRLEGNETGRRADLVQTANPGDMRPILDRHA